MADGYDPRRSKVSESRMEDWRKAQVTAELLEVPGVGPAAAAKLKEDGVSNNYQLFGKFLSLKGPDSDDHQVEAMEHTEKFWQYLKQIGISAHRSAIVKAIAEKCATFMPGIYDGNDWESDEDDDDE